MEVEKNPCGALGGQGLNESQRPKGLLDVSCPGRKSSGARPYSRIPLFSAYDGGMTPTFFRLMIHCPETGKPIPLRMTMEQGKFDRCSIRDMRTRCPHCQHTHTWQKTDVTLEPTRASFSS
jgi:hypothetical protein